MLWFSKELLKRAKAGYPREQYDIANCYKNGLGIALDEKKAAKWFLKAAKQNHIEAEEEIALCYYNGLGIKKSIREAIYWWERAIQNGSDTAPYNLTCCYLECGMVSLGGVIDGMDGKYIKNLLLLSVNKKIPEACLLMGKWYEEGKYVGFPNLKEALEYYKMADTLPEAREAAERVSLKLVQ